MLYCFTTNLPLKPIPMHTRWKPHSFACLILLPLLVSQAHSRFVNRTIDDQWGDESNREALPRYYPICIGLRRSSERVSYGKRQLFIRLNADPPSDHLASLYGALHPKCLQHASNISSHIWPRCTVHLYSVLGLQIFHSPPTMFFN